MYETHIVEDNRKTQNNIEHLDYNKLVDIQEEPFEPHDVAEVAMDIDDSAERKVVKKLVDKREGNTSEEKINPYLL